VVLITGGGGSFLELVPGFCPVCWAKAPGRKTASIIVAIFILRVFGGFIPKQIAL
jgi:hypothetical protein